MKGDSIMKCERIDYVSCDRKTAGKALSIVWRFFKHTPRDMYDRTFGFDVELEEGDKVFIKKRRDVLGTSSRFQGVFCGVFHSAERDKDYLLLSDVETDRTFLDAIYLDVGSIDQIGKVGKLDDAE